MLELCEGMEKMEKIKIKNLLNLNETVARDIFKGCDYPWEVLPKIEDFIMKLGKSLDKNKYDEIDGNIWVSKTAKISPTTYIAGPCIIDEEAEIRHCAYIRENVIIGKGAVVGNSTELKNVILFNEAKVPHYNYVGDSIVGYKAHMGAGAILSNFKSDGSSIAIKYKTEKIPTNLRKFGAILGDKCEIGCGAVLNPGSIIGRNSNIYPLSFVRGVVEENCIYKNQNEIVEKN